jgi:hypothetical protein
MLCQNNSRLYKIGKKNHRMAHLIKFREIKMLNYSHSNAKFLSEKTKTESLPLRVAFSIAYL